MGKVNQLWQDECDLIAERLTAGELDREQAVIEWRAKGFTEDEAAFFAEAAAI